MFNNNLFFNQDLLFESSASILSEEQIKNILPFDFKGKDDFVKFYHWKNGGYFSKGAYFYRDIFFDVSKERFKTLSVESFYFIPQFLNEKSSILRSILEVWELRKNIQLR